MDINCLLSYPKTIMVSNSIIKILVITKQDIVHKELVIIVMVFNCNIIKAIIMLVLNSNCIINVISTDSFLDSYSLFKLTMLREYIIANMDNYSQHYLLVNSLALNPLVANQNCTISEERLVLAI